MVVKKILCHSPKPQPVPPLTETLYHISHS